MKYNLSNIMKAANTYAQIMSRSEALRKAWANEKAQAGIKAIMARPDELQPGDRVAIQVGARWGEVHWYTFAQLGRDNSATEVVAGFEMGADWPPIEFVLSKNTRYVVEQRTAIMAAIYAA